MGGCRGAGGVTSPTGHAGSAGSERRRLNKLMRFLQPPCCPTLAVPGMWALGHPELVGFGWTPAPGTRRWSSPLLPHCSPQQRKRSPGVLLPSLAPPPPGLMLLQHRCLPRAQVRVPPLPATAGKLCPKLRARALSLPSPLLFPPNTRDCHPSPDGVSQPRWRVPARGGQPGAGMSKDDPVWERSTWFSRPFPACSSSAGQRTPCQGGHAPAPVAAA